MKFDFGYNLFNFGEDGPWAWYWHVIRSGCLHGHEWETYQSYEEYILYEEWRECLRCGAYGGHTVASGEDV